MLIVTADDIQNKTTRRSETVNLSVQPKKQVCRDGKVDEYISD